MTYHVIVIDQLSKFFNFNFENLTYKSTNSSQNLYIFLQDKFYLQSYWKEKKMSFCSSQSFMQEFRFKKGIEWTLQNFKNKTLRCISNLCKNVHHIFTTLRFFENYFFESYLIKTLYQKKIQLLLKWFVWLGKKINNNI